MKSLFRTSLFMLALTIGAVLAMAASTLPSYAQPGNTVLFSSQKGDITFPLVAPEGGTGYLDNTNIGSGTPAPGTFSQAQIDSGTRTATATSGAATLNKNSGQITSESLTTAAGAVYTLTLTDSSIAATDLVMASVQYGSSNTGSPAVMMVTPGAGSVVIKVQNIHASAALNGTIKISFVDFK